MWKLPYYIIMTLELKISDVETFGTTEEDGTHFDHYRLTAHRGDTEVGSLVIVRVKESSNPAHQGLDLLFERGGKSRSYVGNLGIYEGHDADEVGAQVIAEVGAELLRAGNRFSEETFGTSLYGSEVLLSDRQQLARDCLLQTTGIIQVRDTNVPMYQVL